MLSLGCLYFLILNTRAAPSVRITHEAALYRPFILFNIHLRHVLLDHLHYDAIFDGDMKWKPFHVYDIILFRRYS